MIHINTVSSKLNIWGAQEPPCSINSDNSEVKI
jgi:hypothetical protein